MTLHERCTAVLKKEAELAVSIQTNPGNNGRMLLLLRMLQRMLLLLRILLLQRMLLLLRMLQRLLLLLRKLLGMLLLLEQQRMPRMLLEQQRKLRKLLGMLLLLRELLELLLKQQRMLLGMQLIVLMMLLMLMLLRMQLRMLLLLLLLVLLLLKLMLISSRQICCLVIAWAPACYQIHLMAVSRSAVRPSFVRLVFKNVISNAINTDRLSDCQNYSLYCFGVLVYFPRNDSEGENYTRR